MLKNNHVGENSAEISTKKTHFASVKASATSDCRVEFPGLHSGWEVGTAVSEKAHKVADTPHKDLAGNLTRAMLTVHSRNWMVLLQRILNRMCLSWMKPDLINC